MVKGEHGGGSGGMAMGPGGAVVTLSHVRLVQDGL
jgi:hypothetical protein